MSQKRRERQYPLDQPPDGVVVEPALPNRNPMTPSQTSVNNSFAGDDENLPPVTDAQGNPLPLTEFGGMEDYAEEPVPAEVRQATANIPETGTLFNLAPFEQIAQLHAAGQTEEARKVYNSLNDQAKYVYNNARNMERFTAQEGARLADEFRKAQDARTKAMEDPLKQAQLEERQAKLQERKSVQTDFKIRRDNTIKNIEEILGDKSYASLVGPFDGTVGGVYDAAFNEKAQAKRAKLDRLVNFDVLDMTKYLRPISQDELKYLRTLVPGQTQNWEVYKQYLGEKLEMLKATDKAAFNPATSLPLAADDAPAGAQPTAAAPSAAQGRNTFTTPDGYTYRRLPDGSAELVE
jgi:hypothetical protein